MLVYLLSGMSFSVTAYTNLRMREILYLSLTIILTCMRERERERERERCYLFLITQVLSGVVSRLARHKVIFHVDVERLSKFQMLQARQKFRETSAPGPQVSSTMYI